MPKFVFTLNAVLRQRSLIEQDRQRALAAIERERLRLEAAIQHAALHAEDERTEARVCLMRGDIASAAAQNAAVARILRQRMALQVELVALEPKLHAARAALLAAAKDRKSMELLRDQRLAEWRETQARTEQAALDEVATMRHGRPSLTTIEESEPA